MDIETYSDRDLTKCGVYKYVESPNFEILLFAYSIDFGEVKVVDLASGEKLPGDVKAALWDNNIKKFAYNAQFERVCLSRFLGYSSGEYLDPKGWYCDMAWAAYLGLPLGLEKVGEVLKLDKQKLTEGKSLIKYFCVPQVPKKSNGFKERIRPADDPYNWELFKTYNKRDVETEMEIHERISRVKMPDFEWDTYHLDQTINDRGIALDMDLVRHAISLNEKTTEENENRVKELTDVDNPNSPKQLIEWLLEQGYKTESLSKSAVTRLLENAEGNVEEILKIRQELAKSSIKKYLAMENAVCADGRARGLLQYYGANRTGRFAGRLIQVQNLPQNHIEDLEGARELVKNEDAATITEKYGNVSKVLSELIRTAFVPKKGCKFIVCDFSAIEARVLAWLAGESWRLESFKNGEDIYCASASKMFGVTVEKNGINGELRQKGKIAELALGYGGSVGALEAMGALNMGLTKEELKPLVDSWRVSNRKITDFWWNMDSLIKAVITEKANRWKRVNPYLPKAMIRHSILFIELPSGRTLSYCKPRIEESVLDYNYGWNKQRITYEGVGSNKNWQRIESYGPKFVENIVQATSRDILVEAMKHLENKGFKVVMHIHDEVVLEVPNRESSVEEVRSIMCGLSSYPGLPLDAAGYECKFYMKD